MKATFKMGLLTCTLLCASSNVFAKETSTAKYVGDTRFASFCKAVVQNDTRMLRASLSRQVGKIAGSEREVLRRVTDSEGLKCNGESLVDFSKRRNANEVYAYLMLTAE